MKWPARALIKVYYLVLPTKGDLQQHHNIIIYMKCREGRFCIKCFVSPLLSFNYFLYFLKENIDRQNLMKHYVLHVDRGWVISKWLFLPYECPQSKELWLESITSFYYFSAFIVLLIVHADKLPLWKGILEENVKNCLIIIICAVFLFSHINR